MSNDAGENLLRRYFERFERLETEEAELAQAKRELLAELKANGFDRAAFLRCIKARKADPRAAAEAAALDALYLETAAGKPA